VLSLRLESDLGFVAWQTGWVYAASALGAILGALVAGQVADRWMASERCLFVCGLIVGGLLLAMSWATAFWLVFVLCLAVWFFMVQVSILGVTLTMSHLQSPEQQFSRVRMWGTISWVAAGLALGWWLSQPGWMAAINQGLGRDGVSVGDSLVLAALLAFVLAGYALTLPHTPPAKEAKSWLAPLQALHLLRNRNFAVFCACGFLLHMTLTFQIQMTSLLLQHLGVPKESISPSLTIAQWSEIGIMWVLPAVSMRLGMRGTLLTGLAALTLALTILTIGQPVWLVLISLPLNGFVICCYIIRGQVFINHVAGREIRSSAQGLSTMINGVGLLLGNLACGFIRGGFGGEFAPTFAVGAGIALFATLLLALGFRTESAAAGVQVRDWRVPVPVRPPAEAASAVAASAAAVAAVPAVATVPQAVETR
jgi:MFS family permease